MLAHELLRDSDFDILKITAKQSGGSRPDSLFNTSRVCCGAKNGQREKHGGIAIRLNKVLYSLDYLQRPKTMSFVGVHLIINAVSMCDLPSIDWGSLTVPNMK